MSRYETASGWQAHPLLAKIVALSAGYSKHFGGLPQSVVLVYTAVNIALIFGLMLAPQFAFPVGPVAVALFLAKNATGIER